MIIVMRNIYSSLSLLRYSKKQLFPAGRRTSRLLFSSSSSSSSSTADPDSNREFICEIGSAENEGVVLFRMNRPAAKNALGRQFVGQFWKAIETVHKMIDKSRSSGVRVVVLKSDVPGVFCAGADLKERMAMTEKQVPKTSAELRRLARELEQLPVPVIAAIDGVALGGGLEMAMACDIRVASAAARMGLVETKLGLIPGAGGTQRLARLIGSASAKEMIFTGRVVDGVEAYRLGLVNHVVVAAAAEAEEGAAFRRALELAREILPQAPIAVRAAKVAVDRGAQMDIDSAMVVEGLCYARIVPTKDRLEGLASFREKRPPVYKGE